MKKLLSSFIAILFAFSVSNLCFAKEAAKPAAGQPKAVEKTPDKADQKIKKTKKVKKPKTKKSHEKWQEGKPAPIGK